MTPEELHELNLRCVRAMGKVLCAKDCPVCAANSGATHECDFYESHGAVFIAGGDDGDTFSPATRPAEAHAMVSEFQKSRAFMSFTTWHDGTRWRVRAVRQYFPYPLSETVHESEGYALSLAFCEAVERTRT